MNEKIVAAILEFLFFLYPPPAKSEKKDSEQLGERITGGHLFVDGQRALMWGYFEKEEKEKDV